MVTKVAQVSGLVKRGIENPESAFPEIRKMAVDADWEVREVAATALVEISRKRADEVRPRGRRAMVETHHCSRLLAVRKTANH